MSLKPEVTWNNNDPMIPVAQICSKWPGRLPVGLLLAVCMGMFGSAGFCQTADAPAGDSLQQMLPGTADPQLPVYLYFVDPENDYLVSEARHIADKEPLAAYCRKIVEALIQGPNGRAVNPIPDQTALRAVYPGPKGVVYVDLTAPVKENHPGGVRSEMMTVYAIVNTLILNVSPVERVKLLIEGQEADTLAGHIDIRYPLKADMLLVR